MFDALYSIIAFLVAISILIAVHEFGHFWVAKTLGVKVLRYAIGFGKPLWKRTAGPDQTEYVIGSLPLGGYVKMLDEREMEVAQDELGRSFNRQKVSTRFAIVAAGPLFNFLFAIVAYWLMLGIGVSGIKPVIGKLDENSVIAKAGFVENDEIVSINGHSTPIWDVALKELIAAAVEQDIAVVEVVEANGLSTTKQLDFSGIENADDPSAILKTIGLKAWQPRIRPVVGQVVPDSPAAAAGMQKNDEIIELDKRAIQDWFELVEYVGARPETSMEIKLSRDNVLHTLQVRTGVAERDGKKVGRLGIAPLKSEPIPPEMKAEHKYGLLDGIIQSSYLVWRNSTLTLSMIGKLIMGEASLKNLSGPINIAVYAGYSASAGLPRFLDFLAIVSISLAVINLLPIPVLDGGHLFYYLIEMVKGSPVSAQFEAVGQRIGILIIVMMMGLAIMNDIFRLLGN